MAAAIVVAGGSGERYGREGGKQLATVAGWPVLSWALRAMDAVPDVKLLIVVCPEERQSEYLAEAIEPLALSTPVVLAPSGSTRQQSVMSGLQQLPPEVEVVLVHDGARPLVTPDLARRTIVKLLDSGASGAIVAHPSFDTLKVVEGGRVVETPDRALYWAVQTPQTFVRADLVAAHVRAASEGFTGTDDASLLEWDGRPVIVVEGPRDNIKVTVPEDLAFVQAALGRRREGE